MFLLFLMAVVYEAMLTRRVQTFLAQRVTTYLSEKMGTRVHVDRVYIRFVKTVVLDGLLVEDKHHKTLLYAKQLRVDISKLDLTNNILAIKSIRLSNADFNIMKYKGEQHDNLYYFTEFFASSGPKDTTSSKLKITIQNIRLDEVHFTKGNENKIYDTLGVDFNNLDVKHVNGDLNDIHFVEDSTYVTIRGLALEDHGGFVMNNLSADVRLSPGQWRFNKLQIITPQTELFTDLSFYLDSIDDFDEFDTKVNWTSSFKTSTVSLKDIAYFAHDLWGRTNKLKLSGDIKGLWSKFRAKNVFLGVGDNTWLKGDIAMTGLSDIEETFIEINAKEARGTKAELETIPIPPFNSSAHLELPDNISELGVINFKGRFTGFINDFVAYGNINTALGYISTDINLKLNNGKNPIVYKGHMAANNFNAGRFLAVKGLGNVSGSIDIKGSGVKKENADANLTGLISSLDYKNYAYKNLKINSEISKKLFSGSLSVRDDNVDLDFNGTIDFRNKLPEFDFTATIAKARLDTLNLFRLQNKAELQTTLKIQIKGDKLDNLEGRVEAINTNYHSETVAYRVNSVQLKSLIDKSSRYIYLNSDFLDATIDGKFEFATLVDGFGKILPRYLPSVILPSKINIMSRQDFNFDFHFKNTNLITENFLPQWYIEPNTLVKGHYSTIDNDIKINVESPLLRYSNYSFYDARLKIAADSTLAKVDFIADHIMVGSKTRVEASSLEAAAHHNVIDFRINMADTVNYASHADVNGNIAFESSRKFGIHFDNAAIYVERNQWALDPLNAIAFDSSAIKISHLGFTNENQELQITGITAENDTDVMQLMLKNFQLNNLNPFLGNLKLGGSSTGSASVRDLYRNMKVSSDLVVNQLAINGDTLGNAKLISRFDNENKVLAVNASIVNGTKTVFSANGQYFTAKKDDNLDFKIHLEDLNMEPIRDYVNDIMDLIYAKLSGDLELHGSTDRPLFKGMLSLQRVRVLVNYLNTRYSFTNNVIVNENNFELKEFAINDVEGSSAKVNGKIYHDNFTNFRFDVSMTADNFQVLNTNVMQNDLYYGTAFGSGYATFYGPPDNMKMYIALKSERKTQIYLPLTGETEVSQSDFITFISKTRDTASKAVKPLMTGLDLNLDMEITPDAQLQMIFDEKIGDKITGRGSGNLNLTLSPAGDLALKGQFIIDKGDYLFTLQNVINRHFIINSGGVISWNGDPFGAMIDLSASYKTRASLYDLTLDSAFRESVPIECKLLLTDKLMNPKVNFDITAPGAKTSAQTALQSYLNNEFEKSRQVASLLFQNRFMMASSLGVAGQAQVDAAASVSTSASQLLTNQLNVWLSQVSKDVTFGVNYHAKDVYSKEEIDLMFSKSILNDRVTIDGNVGVASGNSAASTTNASSLVGDFSFEYKASDKVRFRVFNKTNTNTLLFNNAPYTQGLGIFFRREFDTLESRKKKLQKKATAFPRATSGG